MIIAAYAGTGKTYYAKNSNRSVIDLDSSQYGKDPGWIQKYVSDIIKHSQEYDFVLVSTHPQVLNALYETVYYKPIVVYPQHEAIDEYIRRWEDRGSSGDFINLMVENWNQWITNLDNDIRFFKFKLYEHDHLNYAMNQLYNTFRTLKY